MEQTMKVIIPEPAQFYSPYDEIHFFRWFRDIAAITDAVRTEDGIQLTIKKKKLNRFTVYNLLVILQRYNVPMGSLRTICRHVDPVFFRDEDSFWYDSVFKDT
jgi:hypothetical protein